MLRYNATRSLRQLSRPSTVNANRRAASSVSEAASKVSEAASKVKDTAAAAASHSHSKPSSDVPWAIGSLLVFAPLLVWMTSPTSKKDEHHHLPAPKEKFKPQVRMPDPNAFHYQIPEDKEDTAGEGRPHGEGDAGLRAKAEEHEHMAEKQNSPEPAQTASNHDAKPGLKGDPDKFNAAARGSQQANQAGGGAAAQDSAAMTHAAREASANKSEVAKIDSVTPDNVQEKVGEKVTERKEGQADEDQDNKSEDKDEQQ